MGPPSRRLTRTPLGRWGTGVPACWVPEPVLTGPYIPLLKAYFTGRKGNATEVVLAISLICYLDAELVDRTNCQALLGVDPGSAPGLAACGELGL